MVTPTFDKGRMKNSLINIGTYFAALLAAGVVASLVSVPFLTSGDFSVQFQAIAMGVLTEFYLACFLPLVLIVHFLIRGLRSHRRLPLTALPCFGAFFPVAGFVFLPQRWWPEEPFDMLIKHWGGFTILAALSIGIGIIFVLMKHRRLSNQKMQSISA